MGDDSTIGERATTPREKREKDGFATLQNRKSLEEDTLETPSRTSSLTPTIARTLERRADREPFVVNVRDEDGGTTEIATSQVPIATPPIGKPNRKVRPTRRASAQSYTKAPQGISRMDPSPSKRQSGEDSEDGGTGLSTSATSNHSRSSALDASGSAPLAHLPVSTDNLLHHLHTDPRSSHITLSASAGAGAKVPPATLNPALLAAGGDPSGGKAGARSRALSASTRSDKANGTSDGNASLPASRSVSKKPSLESRISERRAEEEKALRDYGLRRSSPGPRIGLSRSTSSTPTANQLDSSVSTPSPFADLSAASDSSHSAPREPYDPVNYFNHRARAASSSDTRSNGSRGFISTTSTPMEDWPSHDVAHDSMGGTNEGHTPSMDFSSDLVGGGLAGTPRRGSEAEPQNQRLPSDADHVEVSPRTGSGSGGGFPRSPKSTLGNVYDSEPDSGLVAVTVSDSTSVKLETLVPGDVADKIQQTDDVKGKQAMLDEVGGTSPASRPPASRSGKRSSDEPRGGLGFSNLDLSEANLASPPPEERTPRPAVDGDHPEFEAEGEVCMNEFSSMLAEAMRGTVGGTERRSSTDSSGGGSVTSSRRSAKLIGTAGSLDESGTFLLSPQEWYAKHQKLFSMQTCRLGLAQTPKGSEVH